MISATSYETIQNVLSQVFFLGFKNGYSSTTIEERIINNKYIIQLENGDDSFLNLNSLDEIISSFYDISIEQKDFLSTNTIALWLGEIYTRLFFTTNKSFSYLFLYFTLDDALYRFDIYHEMDIGQLDRYFNQLEQKNTIISLLLKKHDLSIRELSVLTNVNYHTLESFKRSNDTLFKGSFSSIYQISHTLKENINLFASHINNVTNTEMFDFDQNNQEYRSYLGHLIGAYFSTDIFNEDYEYQKDRNLFQSKSQSLKVLLTSQLNINNSKTNLDNFEQTIKDYVIKLNDQQRSNLTIVVFEYNGAIKDKQAYLEIKQKYELNELIIIDSYDVYQVKKKCQKRFMSQSVYNQLINQAKQKVGGDFGFKL